MNSVSPRSRLKSALLCGLAGLNALLLAVLIAKHTPANEARAAGRPVGDVIAIPGTLTGFTEGVVFLFDPQNQRLGVISTPTAGRGGAQVQAMKPLDLGPLLNAAGGVRGR